jgi:hypothetical protein
VLAAGVGAGGGGVPAGGAVGHGAPVRGAVVGAAPALAVLVLAAIGAVVHCADGVEVAVAVEVGGAVAVGEAALHEVGGAALLLGVGGAGAAVECGAAVWGWSVMVEGGWMGGGRTFPAEPGDIIIVAADELAQLCAAGLAACHVDGAESIGWLARSPAVSALCF